MADLIRVQVAYARPDSIFLKELALPSGSSLQQALEESGLQAAEPSLDWQNLKTGIHGKLKPSDTVLRDGDRVEVYRPLLADPKDARRRRAVKQKREAAAR